MRKIKVVALIAPELEAVLISKSLKKLTEFELLAGHYVQVGIECERRHKERKR